MASFTDTQGIQFNPYIQQLPVDEYMRTGMLKQQRYDEGVQRIQGYIDTIGGLPVVGDANIALLTEKMEKLRTSLEGVTGADFGKMNLQMQVGSLASQIAKDPAITVSVEAARKIQVLESSIDEARKSGKGYSAANEAYVKDYVNQYVSASNKEAGLTYGGPTSIHNITADDVHKKIKDVISTLKGMEDIDYSLTGGKVMLKNEDKILDATRIKAAIEASLTADDRKAISIDGWYNTYGKSDEELVNTSTGLYTEIANRATQMSDYYNNVALLTEGMSDDDKLKYKNIADQHAQYASSYNNLATQVKESYGTPAFNREQIAGDMWREKIETSYSGAYQFRQQKKDAEVSPAFNVWAKEQELIYRGIEAETARLKALTDGKDSGGISSVDGAEAINVDPNSSKYQNIYSTKATQEKIAGLNENLSQGGVAQEASLKAYAFTLKDMSNPDAADQSGLIIDPTSPDGYRWKSKADRERVMKLAQDATINYKRASLDGTFTGPIPLSNKAFREAHLSNIAKGTAAGLLKQSDDNVTAKATEGRKMVNPNEILSFKDKSGKETKISLGELARMRDESIELSPSTLPISAGGGTPTYVVKSGSKYAQFLDSFGDNRKQITETLGKYGINLNELNSLKDKIYKEWDEAVTPRMLYASASDKQKTTGEWDLYQKSVQNNIAQGNVIDIAGNTVDAGSLPSNVKDIEIIGGYLDLDGKVKMRASWRLGSGNDAKTITADVDVSNLKNSLKPAVNPADDLWLYRNFLGDDMPELTEGLFRKGSGGRTSYSEKQQFVGSMFVTGNDRVARNYGLRVDPTKTRTLIATIAIPQVQDGKTVGFRHLDIGEFPNAGAAKRAVEYFYSKVSDKISINELEAEMIKTLGK
jgi:hypothetical protein